MPDDHITMPPPSSVKRACDLCDLAISRYLAAVNEALAGPPTTPNGKSFEVDDECYLLLGMIIRHVESVLALARYDLVLLPGARVLTRAAFDIAAQVLWMLAPNDWFDREVRWLVRLKEEEDYYGKVAREFAELGGDPSYWAEHQRALHNFRVGIEKALPPEHNPARHLSRLPSMRDMLRSVGEEHRYVLYIEGSQYVHGTQVATGLYRRHLGNKKQHGEFISNKHWEECFATCMYSLCTPGQYYLIALGGDPRKFISEAFAEELREGLAAIGAD